MKYWDESGRSLLKTLCHNYAVFRYFILLNLQESATEYQVRSSRMSFHYIFQSLKEQEEEEEKKEKKMMIMI
jgi:predicted kinase